MIIEDKSKIKFVKTGPSSIHGTGVFARQKISKNTKILHYNGEKIPRGVSKKREALQEKKGELWIFEINNYWSIDAEVGGGMAKFVNHSDKPNCWIDIKGHEIWYRASRTLRPGQELTINYGTALPKQPADLVPSGRVRRR